MNKLYQMKKFASIIPALLVMLWAHQPIKAQQLIACDTNTVVGQNLIVNGGFEDGDQDFFTSLDPFQNFNETPGTYLVGSNPNTTFNQAFAGNTHSGSSMLMIDATSDDPTQTIVWSQTVPIEPETNYYFSTFIMNLCGNCNAENDPQLIFRVNGEILEDTIQGPPDGLIWDHFESVWFSGVNPPESVEISIENIVVGGGGDNGGNDFALDDISFTPGCAFADEGETPNLGADTSLCGTNGSIVLDPSLIGGTNVYDILWSTDDTTETITITEPGTYAVCVRTNGSCPRSDIIRVTDNFTIDIGGDTAVCNRITDTLIANHFGPQVTYQWYYNGLLLSDATDSVYIPTQTGTYSVHVYDSVAGCGLVIDEMTLSKGTIDVDLGGPFELCNPSFATLIADYVGTRYQWFHDGVRLSDENDQTLIVNQVGTYTVIVSDSICDDATATAEVTSSTFSGVNGLICPDSVPSTTLTLINATNPVGNYIWYTEPEGGDSIHAGTSFTTPNLTGTTTYYVEDITEFQTQVGPTEILGNCAINGSDPTYWTEFTVHNSLRIDSVLVFPVRIQQGQNDQVAFTVTNLDDNSTVTVTSTVTGPRQDQPSANPQYIPIDLDLEPGRYRVTNVGSNVELGRDDNCGGTFDDTYSDPEGIITIDNWFQKDSDTWHFFKDWHITSTSACDRIPVTAYVDPILCGVCQIPDSVIVVLNGDSTICDGDSVQLTVDIFPNDFEFVITWYQNGQLMTDVVGDTALWVTEPGEYHVTIANPDHPDVCFGESSNTVPVNFLFPPYGDVDIDLGDIDLCPDEPITATAIGDGNGDIQTYDWYVNGDFVGDVNPHTQVFNEGDTLRVDVLITGLNCVDTSYASDSVIIDLNEPPYGTASLTGLTSVCPVDTNLYTATGTPGANITGYSWYLNDVLIPDSNNSTINLSIPDDSELKVVIHFEGLVCVDTDSVADSITINTVEVIDPVVDLNLNSDSAFICELDLPAIYTASSTTGGTLLYSWYLNGVLVPGEDSTVYSPDPVSDGDIITVAMTTTLECVSSDTAFATDTLEIRPTHVIDLVISPDKDPICAGEDVTYTASYNGEGTLSWFLNGNAVGNGEDTYTVTGMTETDVISATFVSDESCPDTDIDETSAQVTINELSVTASPINDGVFCETKVNGYFVSDSTNGGSNPTFQWFVNNVLVDPVPAPDHTFTSDDLAVDDTVIVVMISDNPACIDSARDTVVVPDLQTPMDVSLAISDTTICTDEGAANPDILYTASFAPENLDYTFTWTVDGEELDGDSSSIYLSVDNHTISVTMVTDEFCVTDNSITRNATAAVHNNPTAVIDIDYDNLDYLEGEGSYVEYDDDSVVFNGITKGLNVPFDGNQSVGASTYLWSSAEDMVLFDNEDSVYTFAPIEGEEQYIYLSVANDHCSDMDSLKLIINYTIRLFDGFSPNGDGINDVYEFDNKEYFPNLKLEIYNRWGSLLYTQEAGDPFWDGTNNGESLPMATYYYIFWVDKTNDKEKGEEGTITLIR